MDTLKEYAIKALVNTVHHLGSVTYKVNDLLDEKVDEVSGTELRISCIEQLVKPLMVPTPQNQNREEAVWTMRTTGINSSTPSELQLVKPTVVNSWNRSLSISFSSLISGLEPFCSPPAHRKRN